MTLQMHTHYLACNQPYSKHYYFNVETQFWAIFSFIWALSLSKCTICFDSKLLEIVAYMGGVRGIAPT